MDEGEVEGLRGRDRQAARERAFRLLAATVAALFGAFAILGGLLVWYDNATGMVLHTREVREGISDVHQALSEAEAAHRLYLLTRTPVALGQLNDADQRARRRVTEVEFLTRDNPSQQRGAQALSDLTRQRLALLERGVGLAHEGRGEDALALVRSGQGTAVMRAVREQIAVLDGVEAHLEAERRARAATLRLVGALALLVFAVALGWLFIKALRDINVDREVEAETAERLRGLLQQRTLLLAEVNHRVKNSLQQIASVVRMQSRTTDDPVVASALDKTLGRIVAVGRVHEQIYGNAGKVGDFDAGSYAAGLARELVDSMGREDITLETDVEPLVLDMAQAAPLALIMNELITNALKYGCPPDRPCRLRISLRTVGDHHRLSISDEGDGVPAGFSMASKTSLGMRVVDALSRQLGGSLSVENNAVGATFLVEFPRSVA
ncbi:sensor histidine kinase [Phenylobacterium sp.]|uniref:sensor histidine kinase n=1 Tax=Phenylobacterium sp. TaxID=1871053 RepID=UPI002733B255|nr:CHASE3 domain-containing protein [Phenylobacterium sp.]MDP3659790.1 CHASE3 domain-containing protein [Phenylobacterium sp.]